MTTRTWTCLCGNCQCEVTGDPALACFCHCMQCRRYASTAMQLAAFEPDQFKMIKGQDGLIKYESNTGVFRNSCGTCGSFVYKEMAGGNYIVPLGCLE